MWPNLLLYGLSFSTFVGFATSIHQANFPILTPAIVCMKVHYRYVNCFENMLNEFVILKVFSLHGCKVQNEFFYRIGKIV
jgi:hypothetical protein